MLHEYMIKKKNLLKEADPKVYNIYTKGDAEEIASWPEETRREVEEEIKRNLTDEALDLDDDYLCPWCILYLKRGCRGCGHASRHGNCMEDTSDYSSYVYSTYDEKPFTFVISNYNPSYKDELLLALKQDKGD